MYPYFPDSENYGSSDVFISPYCVFNWLGRAGHISKGLQAIKDQLTLKILLCSISSTELLWQKKTGEKATSKTSLS